ncbi:MAG: hypothetical protein QOI71_445, partial [Gaiellales bacterium]|nr:hypothetical protein [Gaiellales bacterium]
VVATQPETAHRDSLVRHGFSDRLEFGVQA